MFTHILLASDGSPGAFKAAAVAAEVARQFHSRLTVLTVRHSPSGEDPEETPLAHQVNREIIDDIQRHILGATGRIVDGVNVASEDCQRYGNPAERIAEVAEAEHCDLIVLGSRGLGGVKSCLLGGVSDRVTHRAHCPVLIVR